MNLKKRHIQPSGKKQNQTQISTELKAPCTVPRSCHSSFSSSSLARSVVADDSFRDQICGRGYASVDKLPLPISGTSSQQSLVPTPINPTKTIAPLKHTSRKLCWERTGMFAILTSLTTGNTGPQHVRNPICIAFATTSIFHKPMGNVQEKY